MCGLRGSGTLHSSPSHGGICKKILANPAGFWPVSKGTLGGYSHTQALFCSKKFLQNFSNSHHIKSCDTCISVLNINKNNN